MTDRPNYVNADGILVPLTDPMFDQWLADAAAAQALLDAPRTAPDGPTLSDWRTALVLWGRLEQIDVAIANLKSSSDEQQAMQGKVAEQRFQFANNVFRSQLMLFKDALGFSESDVDESLWRANQIQLGDYSGVWPLTS